MTTSQTCGGSNGRRFGSDDRPLTGRTRSTGRRRANPLKAALLIVVSMLASTVVLGIDSGSTAAGGVLDDDWLGVVNGYRAIAGLPPVVADTDMSDGALKHSCYMLDNGITHDEIEGDVGYTPEGDLAAQNGNVAVHSSADTSARSHIDLWMSAPFHAIGLLRPNLATSGFGLCADQGAPAWHSAATLDIMSGLDHTRPAPSTPTLFPGQGSTVPLNQYRPEAPNSLEMCGWTGEAGLPIIALMPAAVGSVAASLTGPTGPIETCVLHAGNVTDPIAKWILAAENAVVLIPRVVLGNGTHSVTVQSGAGNVDWSFDVDPTASLGSGPVSLPDTGMTSGPARLLPLDPYRQVDTRDGMRAVRLQAGRVTEIEMADSSVVAVSANFVAVAPDDYGYLTLYDCATQRPTVSSVGYAPRDVVMNQAIVPLSDGRICVYSSSGTDIVIDVNGEFRAGVGSGYLPGQPQRLHDSRESGRTRLTAGEIRVIDLGSESVVPLESATAVALDVTVVHPDAAGYLSVFPCSAAHADPVSTVNYSAGEVRSNLAIVPIEHGEICVQSLSSVDLVIDFAGHFVETGGYDLQPLEPIRLFDSRSGRADLNSATSGSHVAGGQIIEIEFAGRRGIPVEARAVSINVTATDAAVGSYLTVFPCGELPLASTLNIAPGQAAVAKGVLAALSDGGSACVDASAAMHVVVDISGAFV